MSVDVMKFIGKGWMGISGHLHRRDFQPHLVGYIRDEIRILLVREMILITSKYV